MKKSPVSKSYGLWLAAAWASS